MAVVYVFVSKDEKDVLYVGSTNVRSAVRSDRDALAKRILEHRNCGEGFLARTGIPEEEVKVFFLENLTKADARALEILLINYYEPNGNSQDLYGDGSFITEKLFPLSWKEYNFNRR